MQRPPRPFQTAFWAILLAIGIPTVVFMFGAIRSRQLQSTANPRWAKFAQLTGPKVARTRAEIDSRRIPIRTVSIQNPERPQSEFDLRSFSEASFTGSVTGRRSIEAPVQSEPLPTAVADSIPSRSRTEIEDRPPIIFRPVDDGNDDSHTALLITRFETRLLEVRQRLDQLTMLQRDQQADENVIETQLLEVLRKLNDLSTDEFSSRTREGEAPADPSFDSESARRESRSPSDESTSATEVDSSEELSSPSYDAPSVETPHPLSAAQNLNDSVETLTTTVPDLAIETPAALPAFIPVKPEIEESPIRIRRSTDSDTSEIFSMDVRDADIRQVFAKLSEAAQVSIVPSPEVQGRVSLNLHDVRIDVALRALLKSRDYVFEREDDIIIIRTAEEVARLKHQNRKRMMKIYRPNYVSAAELIRLIEPLLSSDGRHSVTSPARRGLSRDDDSPNGEDFDQRATVIVQDVPEVLDQVEQILVDVDVPPLQVSIEAKILSVRLSDGIQHGIDLGQLPCHRDSGTSFAEGGLKHASLSCNVPTFVKSIERLADTSVVTSQRIQVLNKHRAEMLIGDRIGYQSRAGGDVRFMEAGTRLILRPSISADGLFRMEIHPERSSATMTRRTKLPHQSTTELTTQVMVRDGATVVIGGLISEQGTETTNRSTALSAIPIVGIPLRNRSRCAE